MITDGEKRHYFTVNRLSGLFHGITPKHNDNHYCMNCLHSFKTKNKLESHENVCKNQNNCNVKMSKARDKIVSLIRMINL